MSYLMTLMVLLVQALPVAADEPDGAPVPAAWTRPGSERHLYVAASAADGGNGAPFAPFRTIQAAANVARPGTTVHVAPGIYRENVRTNAQGGAAARIRYVSDIRWGARVIGSGAEAMWTNKGNHTDIVGFDISGSGRIGILNLASHVLMAANHVHDLEVSGGCTGSGGAGINNANYKASDGDIIGNLVHDIGVPGACNGVHGIYSSNLRGRIYNNIVYRASAWGIHLWHAADQATIANNTVFANGGGRIGGGIVIGTGDSPGGVVINHTKIFNNIVYDNPAASIQEFCNKGQDCTGSNNEISNNLVYGNGGAVSLRLAIESGTIAADPQFVDYQADGSGNYRLKRSSPAIDRGLVPLAPATDIDDMDRALGAAPDLGAYENY